MQARAVRQGPMLTGLLVGEAVPERESDGGVRDVVVCFGGRRVARATLPLTKKYRGCPVQGREAALGGGFRRNPQNLSQRNVSTKHSSSAKQPLQVSPPVHHSKDLHSFILYAVHNYVFPDG